MLKTGFFLFHLTFISYTPFAYAHTTLQNEPTSSRNQCRGDEIRRGISVSNLGFGEVLHDKIIGLQNYSGLKFSQQLTPQALNKEKLKNLLQEFVHQQSQKSFRYLGNYFDFWHFHVLTHNNTPTAILYHTQENAHENLDPSCKYTYIDTQARNWIQWIENPTQIENAKKYFSPHTAKNNWDQYYTISADDLSFFDQEWSSTQVGFFQVDCKKIPIHYQTLSTNFFTLHNSEGKSSCFLFTGNTTCSSEWGIGDFHCLELYLKK